MSLVHWEVIMLFMVVFGKGQLRQSKLLEHPPLATTKSPVKEGYVPVLGGASISPPGGGVAYSSPRVQGWRPSGFPC